jgi:hypothetical protein
MVIARQALFWILCSFGLLSVALDFAQPGWVAISVFTVFAIFLWSVVFFWMELKLSRAGFIVVILYWLLIAANLWRQGYWPP